MSDSYTRPSIILAGAEKVLGGATVGASGGSHDQDAAVAEAAAAALS